MSLEKRKIHCAKQQPKGQIVALSSVIKPSDIILNKLKEYNVNSIVKMASSYKFCVIATGDMIFMLLEKEQMNGIMQLDML